MTGYVKNLQVIFRALLTGQVLFLGVAIYLKYKNLFPDSGKENEKTLQVAAIIISLMLVWSGFKLFNAQLKKIREGNMKLPEKLSLYRSGSITQWAMTEGASLFSITGFLLTGNYAFTGLTVLLLFIFSGYFPVKAKMIVQMGLSSSEADQL